MSNYKELSHNFFKLYSNKLLAGIQEEIINNENFIEKRIYGFLESFIILLDTFEDANFKILVNRMFHDLDTGFENEKNELYKRSLYLANNTFKGSLVKWKLNNEISYSRYETLILRIQNNLFEFYESFKDQSYFTSKFCKMLYQVPRLVMLKQGLKLYTLSLIEK